MVASAEPVSLATCNPGRVRVIVRAEATAEDRGGSSLSSSAHRYFDRWLVLELADGRLAYVPPNVIKYLERAREP